VSVLPDETLQLNWIAAEVNQNRVGQVCKAHQHQVPGLLAFQKELGESEEPIVRQNAVPGMDTLRENGKQCKSVEQVRLVMEGTENDAPAKHLTFPVYSPLVFQSRVDSSQRGGSFYLHKSSPPFDVRRNAAFLAQPQVSSVHVSQAQRTTAAPFQILSVPLAPVVFSPNPDF
jgi:hypothetical protein